ncbi:fatty acyl-CoA reductase wat-like [Calliphora vicina]|uniref:fatty acyl-CoA reductase wat-like n=1 Tax=Calliphora vicina TaxID=7373 RepID=UPI00325BDAEA
MIPEFYEDKEIFITGGSGIVGTALIEQILRFCNVRKIYLLLRPKRNMTLAERLEKVKEELVFRKLKIEKPHELDNKLTAIAGDAKLPMLGITAESAKLLKNVSIIYHCAATVRFDEPIRGALKLNVGGTLEALKFAETLKKLEIFMHVSTFFSNPYLTHVEPKFYEAPMDWKFCLGLLDRDDVGEEELDIITRKLIVGFPNTYCFTKNLAESLVNDYKHKLPVCIYRPSIVFFALEQPEPGFSPSLMGVMGLYAVTGAGLLKTIYVDKNNRLDISPQDISVKNMLYFTLKAAQLYEKKSKPKEIPVYMTSNCTHFNMTLVQYLNIMDDFGLWEKGAYEKSLLVPGVHYTTNRFVYMFFVFLLQLLPALFVDFILMLMGRKPVLMRIQRKVFQTLEVMQPFMFNNYESEGITDFKEMHKQLKGTNFDVNILLSGCNLFTNANFCKDMVFSVRDLLFKEDPKTLPKSRRIFQIKVWLYKFIKFLVLYKVFVKLMEYIASYYTEWRHNGLCSFD